MKRLLLYVDDFLIVLGFGLITYATARLNLTAAIYVAGVSSIIMGILMVLGGVTQQKGGGK